MLCQQCSKKQKKKKTGRYRSIQLNEIPIPRELMRLEDLDRPPSDPTAYDPNYIPSIIFPGNLKPKQPEETEGQSSFAPEDSVAEAEIAMPSTLFEVNQKSGMEPSIQEVPEPLPKIPHGSSYFFGILPSKLVRSAGIFQGSTPFFSLMKKNGNEHGDNQEGH